MANQVLSTLLEYRDQVLNTGKVCKSDIVAIEEFLGDTVVSEKVNLDKLTEVPSRIGVDDVLETLNEKIDAVKSLDVAPTNKEIVEVLTRFKNVILSGYESILKRVLDTESHVSSKLHEAMLDEKIIFRYNEENQLIDITNLPVDEVYSKYKDYFKDVFVNIYGEEKGFLLPEISRTDYNPSLYWNVLHSLIHFTTLSQAAQVLPAMISVKDIASICEHANELLEIIAREKQWIDGALNPDRTGDISYMLPFYELAKKVGNERSANMDEYDYIEPIESLFESMIKVNRRAYSDSPSED